MSRGVVALLGVVVVLAAAPSALAARSTLSSFAARPGHAAHAAHAAHATPARHGKPDRERPDPSDQQSVVQAWARMLGKELIDMARSVTRFDRLQESIKKMPVEVRDPERVLNEVVRDMERLLQRRASQVQKLRKAAEELGLGVGYRQWDVPRPYVGVKDYEVEATPPPPTTTPAPASDTSDQPAPATTTTEKPWLVQEGSFPSPVNVSLSAVHVPAEVYDGSAIPTKAPDPDEDKYGYEEYSLELISSGAEVQRVIRLTEGLDKTFVSNMNEDWSTSWQFFAHHTGVMRQYPASKWNRQYDKDNFDARLRPWYLRAATSPKDVVILLDNSGSMKMEEPRSLTKIIAHTILDTLTPDDFVTVLLYYKNDTFPLLPGLNLTLIPATSAYVRELQFALELVQPDGIGNLTKSLDFSFQLLERWRRESAGANCNQAIMLVTDLVPEREDNVFRMYNWPGKGQANVRVFPFTVTEPGKGKGDQPGMDATDSDDQWTACANLGWHERFWKMSSPAPVLKYMSVMARPMVLQGAHPVLWSHMYADVTVPGKTDQLWIKMERDEQLRRITPYCFRHEEVERGARKHFLNRLPIQDRPLGQHEEFVVTVSVPVYNLSSPGVAEGALLGVVGIDVPVSQLTALISPHKLGVNAYIFMVTNNGLIVFHPDLRPKFNGILKPGFNSLDMSEVEQEDVPDPRNLSQAMQNFRERVVNQSKGSIVLSVRQTYRNWRRVARLARRYYFQGLANTPYSLVLATPLDYGEERIKASHDTSLTSAKLLSVLGSERGPHGGWQVHPLWTYCGCCGQPGRQGLDHLSLRGQNCDRELANALAMDADTTKFYAERIKDSSKWDEWDVFSAFVATHSGLTRWTTRPINDLVPQDTRTPPVPPRGPDEPWFQRAVYSAWSAAAAASESESRAHDKRGGGGAQPGPVPHWVVGVPMQDERGADVYSEYNAAYDPEDPWAARHAGLADDWKGEDVENKTEADRVEELGQQPASITAALFRGKAPAAVTGVQFPLAKLHELFERVACQRPETFNCTSEKHALYLLDENAIVVADMTGLNAGRPLALVNADLMARLEMAHVFERVTVNDVQGVCRRLPSGSPALTPSLGATLLGTVAAAALWLAGAFTGTPGGAVHTAHPLLLCAAAVLLCTAEAAHRPKPGADGSSLLVAKTKLQLCDMKMHLHRVGRGLHLHHRGPQMLGCDDKNGTAPGARPFLVAAVPGTNLILVAALSECPPVNQTDPFRTAPWEAGTDADGESESTEGEPAFRKMGPQWPRRRPADCYRRHDREPDIQQEMKECRSFNKELKRLKRAGSSP